MRRTGGINNGAANNGAAMPYHQTHTTAFHQTNNGANNSAVQGNATIQGELGIISGNALNLNRAQTREGGSRASN